MRVIILAVILNTLVFIANVVFMNGITKDAYKKVKRFAEFKCLFEEFKKYDASKSKRFGEFFVYLIFAIPIVNIITFFISYFYYDDMVKDVQKTTVDEFMAWIENRKVK